MADTYLLRSTTKGVAYYLSHVSDDGCNVEFDRRIHYALNFTSEARANLEKKYAHIRGRWVLLDREQQRIADKSDSGAHHG